MHNLLLVTASRSAYVLALLVPVLACYISSYSFHALCIIFYLYFTRILRVTVCECHIEIKGYLLTYLNRFAFDAVIAERVKTVFAP